MSDVFISYRRKPGAANRSGVTFVSPYVDFGFRCARDY